MQSLPFTVIGSGTGPLVFSQVSEYLVAELPRPGNQPLLTISLTTAIPADKSLCLYYSVPPYDNLNFLTAVANGRPSDIVNTSFQLNADVNTKEAIKVVVKAEDILKADTLLKDIRPDFQKQYAVKVAESLYNFISSYETHTLSVNNRAVEYNLVPKDVFERWMTNFEKKYALDKNFLLK